MLIGGHVSAAGGLTKAVGRAEKEGFEVMQVFASSPRSLNPAVYPDESAKEFRQQFQQSTVEQLFFHAVYLLNLASSKQYLVDLSIKSLISYLEVGDKVNCQGTIFHIGSSKERSYDEVKEQVATAMTEVLKSSPESQNLIMESAAGAGNVVGDSLEELAELYKMVGSKRLKVCLDTQHLYASGVNVADPTIFGNWLKRFDQMIGIDNLVAMHANDSKMELGSHRDRHENIGEGLIGLEGFRSILAQPLLQNVPFILEVPGLKDEGPDRANKDLLLQLL